MNASSESQSGIEVGPPNTGLGVVLFGLYAILLAAFVALNIAVPEIMTRDNVPISDERTLRLGGMNLAVVLGCGLIFAAIMFVLIFMRLTRRSRR